MNPGYAKRMVDSRQQDMQRLARRQAPRRPGALRPGRHGGTAGQRHGGRPGVMLASSWRSLAAAVGGQLVRTGTWLQDRKVPVSSGDPMGA